MLVIMLMDEEDTHGRVMSGRVEPETAARILHLIGDVLVDGRTDVDWAEKIRTAFEQPEDVPTHHPVGELVPGSIAKHVR